MSRMRWLFIIVASAVFLGGGYSLTPGSCMGSTPAGCLILESREVSYALRPAATVFVDSSSRLTISDVSSASFNARFVPVTSKQGGEDASTSRFWLRVTLQLPPVAKQRPGLDTRWVLSGLESVIDRVELYIPDQGRWQVQAGGRKVSWEQSGNPYEPLMLDLNLHGQQPVTVYLSSADPALFDLTVENLARVQDRLQQRVFIHAAYCGLGLGLLGYALLIWSRVRNRVYLYGAGLFVVSLLSAVTFNGPLIPAINDYPPETLNRIIAFCETFQPLFLILIAVYCLDIRRLRPRMYAFMVVLTAGHLAWWVIATYAPSVRVPGARETLMLGTPGLLSLAGLISWMQGVKSGRFILVAGGSIAAAVFVNLFSGTRWVPITPEAGFISLNVLGAACLAAVLLASFDYLVWIGRARRTVHLRERRLRSTSLLDQLTSVYDREFLESKICSEIEHALRLNRQMSIIVMDVDDFSDFRERFGTEAGETVLKTLGQVLRRSVRETDSPCRYEDEEFVVLLTESGSEGALSLSERIRRAFSDETARLDASGSWTCTLSSGIAQLEPGDDSQSLFYRADRSLYTAKASGKNRTMVAESAPESDPMDGQELQAAPA